jgi:hypothetical protein
MNERRGARRFKQHGGGVVSAIKNLFSTIIQRSGGYIITSDNISGATIGQVSDAIATTQHGTLTRILLGGIGTIGTISTMLTGNNHAANLALAAINILNQVIGTVPLTTIMANSISGITAWVPVAGALVPLAAKFSIIGACFIAIRETNKFVLELGRKEAGKLTQMEFKELLVELCKRIFSILMRGGTGVIQARLSAANSAAAAGGGGAPPVKTPSWFSTLFSRLGGGGASEGGGGGGKCHVITAKEQEAIEEVGGQIDTFLSGGEEGEKQEGKNILSALETLAIEAAKRSPLPVSSSSSRVGGGGGGGGGGGSGGGLPKRRQFGGKRSTKKVQKKSTKKSKRKSRRV